MKLPRFMICAGASGSGKTMITCGILQALKDMGMKVCSFKCGPDYIDPMFHRQIIGSRTGNLDSFFTEEKMMKRLLCETASGCRIAVMEGVMGYYDGMGGISSEASAYHISTITETPVVLVVNVKGMSASAAAFINGFKDFKNDSNIRGVILNRMPPSLYPALKDYIERECGVRVVGYVPELDDCVIESRYLGLVTPEEIGDIKAKLRRLSSVLSETVDFKALLDIANEAADVEIDVNTNAGIEADTDINVNAKLNPKCRSYGSECDFRPHERADDAQLYESENDLDTPASGCVRIAVARDEAFCFIYEENLRLLSKMGAEIVEFSPLRDERIPQDVCGMILYGGYPELYADELCGNAAMKDSIRTAIEAGMPVMAECGGFMYLHEYLEGADGGEYSGVGVIEGRAFKTDRLTRFGYVELTAENGKDEFFGSCERCKRDERLGGAIGRIPAHEFHYYDSTSNGDAFTAKKPVGKRSWKCMHSSENMLAGFPHLYYYGNPRIPQTFLGKCRRFRERRAGCTE